MDTQHQLLSLIDGYVRSARISCSYFGKRAINYSDVVNRLRAGGEVLPRTEKRLRDFMRANPPETLRKKRGRKPKRARQAGEQSEQNQCVKHGASAAAFGGQNAQKMPVNQQVKHGEPAHGSAGAGVSEQEAEPMKVLTLKFNARMAPAVVCGAKRQTIRRATPGREWPIVGQKLAFTDAEGRPLGQGICKRVCPVSLFRVRDSRIALNLAVELNGFMLTETELHDFAAEDGFKSVKEMRSFFLPEGAEEFHGQLIEWLPVEAEEKAAPPQPAKAHLAAEGELERQAAEFCQEPPAAAEFAQSAADMPDASEHAPKAPAKRGRKSKRLGLPASAPGIMRQIRSAK